MEIPTCTCNKAETEKIVIKPEAQELTKLPVKKEAKITEAKLPEPTANDKPYRAPSRGSWFNLIFGTPDSVPPPRTLNAYTDENNKAFVTTEDGWKVAFTGESQSWTITSPDGRTTRIWGDPHVVESDGDHWDFHKNSTFVFGDNKVTVETKYLRPGVSYSGTVTVYNGNDRFTITNIDTDKPTLVAWDRDGKAHDASLKDGDIYNLGTEANGEDQWQKVN